MMTEAQKPDSRWGVISRLWRWFWQPTGKYSLGAILIVGGFLGIIFWADHMAFCTSCHEMRQLVAPEYEKSVHYSNPAGVRASCADCHVPKDWTPKLLRKIRATNELFHKIMGTINTKEKFEAKRLELAEHVWAMMKANDSRECRNCHSYTSMDTENQLRSARKKHVKAIKKEQT